MLISDAGRVTLQDSVSGAWLVVPLMLDATLRTWVDVSGPREPILTSESFMYHILVSVVVKCVVVSHFLSAWTKLFFQMGVTLQPVGVGRRSSSRLEAGSNLHRQGVEPTPCGQWKLVKFPSAITGSGRGENGLYTHSFNLDNSASDHDTDMNRYSMEISTQVPQLDCHGFFSAAWGSFLHLLRGGGSCFWGWAWDAQTPPCTSAHHQTGCHWSLGHLTHVRASSYAHHPWPV